MPNLSKTFINQIPTRLNRDIIYWDNTVSGLGLKATRAGNKSFIVQYRFHGKTRRMKLGNYGALMPDNARKIARNILAQVVMGADPMSEKQTARQAPTFQNLADDYMERHAIPHKRPKPVEMDRDMLNRTLLPKLANKKVADISRRDIEPIIIGLKHTPYTANRVRALLSKMFSLAIEWEWADKNPALRIPKFQEHKRMRWLDKDEMERLLDALDRAEYQFSANIVRLLIYTGARRGEVLNAEWSEFDLDVGVWVKPSHNTKQKREERTPLSESAISLLRKLNEARRYDSVITNSPYLFPSPRKPEQAVNNITNFWRGIIKEAELENVRIHDLRHSFASHLSTKWR